MEQPQAINEELSPETDAEPTWQPHGDHWRNLSDQDATPEYLDSVAQQHIANPDFIDKYDSEKLAEHPNITPETLNNLYNHYSQDPDKHKYLEQLAAIHGNPNAPAAIHNTTLDNWLAQPNSDTASNASNPILNAALNHPNVPQEKVHQVLDRVISDPKNNNHLDASRADPAWLQNKYNEAKQAHDDNFHELSVSGRLRDSQKKISHYGNELIDHPNHTPESLSALHNQITTQGNGSAAERLLEKQPNLSHNQVEDLYNKFKPEEGSWSNITSRAFGHNNIDPAFLAHKALTGNDQEKEEALQSEKLPHETQKKITEDAIASGDSNTLAQLLENKSLPSELVHQIYNNSANEGDYARRKAFNHGNFPEHEVENAWNSSDKSRETTKQFLQRDVLPKSVLADIITKGKPVDAAKAVGHKSTDKDILDIAAKRKSKDVKAAIARHPLAAESNVQDYIKSGHVPADQYWAKFDSKLPPEDQAKMHQHYFDKLMTAAPNKKTDGLAGKSAINLYNSPHLTAEQKNKITEKALHESDSYNYGYDDRRAFLKVIGQAANDGNEEAIKKTFSGRGSIEALQLEKAHNPKVISTALDIAMGRAEDDRYSDNDRSGIASKIIANPNLSDDHVHSLLSNEDLDLTVAVADGAISKHLETKTPEQQQQFLNNLAQSGDHGKALVIANPSTPIEMKNQHINSLDSDHIAALAYTMGTRFGEMAKGLPEDTKLKLYSMPTSSRTPMFDRMKEAFSPEQTPLSTLLSSVPSTDMRHILKYSISDKYKFTADAVPVVLQKSPEAFDTYFDRMVSQHPHYSVRRDHPAHNHMKDTINSILPHLNEDNGVHAIIGMMTSEATRHSSESAKGAFNFLLDPAQSPFLDPAAREELIPMALKRDLFDDETKKQIFSDPAYQATLIANASTPPAVKANLIQSNLASGQASDAIWNAIKTEPRVFGSLDRDSDEQMFKSIINEGARRADHDTVANTFKEFLDSKSASSMAITSAMQNIQRNPAMGEQEKNKLILDSYNQMSKSRTNATFFRDRVAPALDETVANAMMATNDMRSLFNIAADKNSSDIFKDTINKIAVNADSLNDDQLGSMLDQMQDNASHLANLTPKNFINVVNASLRKDDVTAIAGTNALSSGIKYSKGRNLQTLSKAGLQRLDVLSQQLVVPPAADDINGQEIYKNKQTVHSGLAQTIMQTSTDLDTQVKAGLQIPDDYEGRVIRLNSDFLNSGDFLTKFSGKKWAGLAAASYFNQFDRTNQSAAADFLVKNYLPFKEDSGEHVGMILSSFSGSAQNIDPEFVHKLFDSQNFDQQLNAMNRMINHGQKYGFQNLPIEHIIDKFHSNVEQLVNGIDATTGAKYDATHPEYHNKIASAIKALIPASVYGGYNNEQSAEKRQEAIAKSSALANKVLSNPNTPIDVKQSIANSAHAIFDMHDGISKIPEESLNDLIANIVDHTTVTTNLSDMIRTPKVSASNTEKILTKSPEQARFMTDNPQMTPERMSLIGKHVLPNLSEFGHHHISEMSNEILTHAQTAGTIDLAIPLVGDMISQSGAGGNNLKYVIKDLSPLSDDHTQTLIRKYGFDAEQMLMAGHGGQKTYDDYVISGSTPSNVHAFIQHPLFDDRGVDLVMNNGRNVTDNIARIVKAGTKVSEAKFNQLTKEHSDVFEKNPNLLTSSPYVTYEKLNELHKKIAPTFDKFIRPGEAFPPTYTNIKYGSKVFRENYPQELPRGMTTLSNGDILKSHSARPEADRLQKAMQVIPPEGIAWAQFKKLHKQMENWPEVKALFMSKNNKPVMPEDVANEIAKKPEQQFHISYSTWDGGQRHSQANNLVVQVNTGEFFDKELGQDQKLWQFYQMIQQSANGAAGGHAGSHPVTPHTIGWVRIDVSSPESFIVEEFQSDFNQKLKKKVRDSLGSRDSFEYGGERYTAKEAEQYVDKISELFKHFNPISYDIVEKLARQQGIKQIYIHGQGVRRYLSGVNEDQHIAAFDEAYTKLPKQNGYSECNYEDYPNHSNRTSSAIKNHQCWVKKLS
jgi:hypothetical protein